MDASIAFVKGATWRIWNSYFQSIEQETPSLHFLKIGASATEGFFVAPVTSKVVADFVKAHSLHFELEFSELSLWTLDQRDWSGEWAVFSARPNVPSYQTQRTGKRR